MIQESIKQSQSWTSGSSNAQLAGMPFSTALCSSTISAYSAGNSNPLISHNWILDSGATNHITFNSNLLSDATPLQSVLHLPNNTTVPITHIGTVHLSSSHTLLEVLCVPSFHCNLISISQLSTQLSCRILFNKNLCVLQDLS